MSAASRLPAATELPRNLLQQNKADQQEIRTHTATIVTQVQQLIDELAANGISGADNKVLEETRAALTNLSGPEMDRVIASLQTAAEAPDLTATEQNAVHAYTGQKGVISQFEEILKEYAQRQAAYELPLRFKELADRQTETLRVTMEVATRTVGKSASELSSMDATTEQIVRSDQAAIVNEVGLAQAQLEKAAAASTDEAARNMQQALADLATGKLQRALNQANEDINAGKMLRAIGEQKVARDELQRVARALNPPPDAVEALKALEGDLAQLLEAQKKLRDQTDGAITAKTADDGLKGKQLALVDKADVLQQAMVPLTPDVSALVKEAITPMQMSRSKLGDLGEFPQAEKSQGEAIAKLEEARLQLEQKVAEAEKAEEEANKDPVEKLEELEKNVDAEIQQQQQIAEQTVQAEKAAPADPANLAAPRQKQTELAQRNAALQQEAKTGSPSVSEDLAAAAAGMEQAQNALTDPAKASGAEQAQTDALSALGRARQDLARQIAQMTAPPAAPADLDAASDAIKQAQSDVDDAAAKAAPAPPGTPDLDAAERALAAAEHDADTAATMPGLPAEAAQDVQEARAEIAKGEKAAGNRNAPDAAGHAAAAQQSLARAQSKVGVAQAARGPSKTPGRISGKNVSHSTHIAGGNNRQGALREVAGADKFIGLEQRQRAAVGQSEQNLRPLEYAPMIDQYMKNLADQASAP